MGTVSTAVAAAVVLCGGRGTRLQSDAEKPLVEVGGRPMIARVLDALAGSRVDRVVAVTSPHTPATTEALRGALGNIDGVACSVHVGSGEGYVADLRIGLDAVDGPAVTVTADLPLVRPRDIEETIDEARESDDPECDRVDSVSVCVPVSLKRTLDASVDDAFDAGGRTVTPTGLNVVADGEERVVIRTRASLAVNVNRPADLRLARRLVRREHERDVDGYREPGRNDDPRDG